MFGDETQPEIATNWTPDADQMRVLDRVYDYYRQTRKWPMLSALCYELRREGKDPEPIIGSIPEWVVGKSNLAGWSWDWPQGIITLTLEGMRFTAAGRQDLEAFVRVLHAIRVLADQHPPESLAEEPVLQVTHEQVAEELELEGAPLDEQALSGAGAILIESSGLTNGGGYGEAFQTWNASIALNRLVAYRDVDSVEAFLAVRKAAQERRQQALAAMPPSVLSSALRRGGLRLGYQAEANAVTIQSSQEDTDPNFIFVVMPFEESWTDQVYGWIRSVVLEMRNSRPGLDVQRSGERRSDGPWITAIQRSIRRAGIVVCDLTDNNANCLYELGFAHGCNRSTVVLTQLEPETLPSDVKAVESVWEYSLENEPGFRTVLRARLLEALGEPLAPE